MYDFLVVWKYKTLNCIVGHRKLNRVSLLQDPLLMYPEEGKKIGRTKSQLADDSNLFFNLMTPTDPLPPPRHKHDAGKTTELNLIEL